MLLGPFPVSLVIERLETLGLLKIVGGVGSLQAALETTPRNLPAAYVLSEETGREPLDYTGAYAQPMSVVIKVVLWTRHAGAADTGAKAQAAMEHIERSVRSHLREWSPSAPFEPLSISNSGQDQYYGGQLLRQVLFRSNYRDQDMTP